MPRADLSLTQVGLAPLTSTQPRFLRLMQEVNLVQDSLALFRLYTNQLKKMALIGYARQHPKYPLSTQVEALTQAGCDLIFQDSSTQCSTELLQALDIYQEGEDVLLTFIHEANSLIQPQFQTLLKFKKMVTIKKPGRPSKKTQDNIDQAVALWQRGHTNERVCLSLNISPSTLNRLKREIRQRYCLFLTILRLLKKARSARLKPFLFTIVFALY